MWFLSIGIFIASMTDFVRSNVNDLSLVGTATSLLFALPSVRNSQPGVPSPVGTTEDSESNILCLNGDPAYHLFTCCNI